MTMKTIPRLCCGTFFSLILEALPDGGGKRKGDFANFCVLQRLIQTMSPEFKAEKTDNFPSVTSKLRLCKPYADILPMTKKARRDSFDGIVTTDYQLALKRMTNFVDLYFGKDEEMRVWLASAIFELLDSDETIDDDTMLYADINGKPIKTITLIKSSQIYMEPLLLGVWHYIVMHRQDNTIGKDTIEDWYESTGVKGDSLKFVGDIGRKYKVIANLMDKISVNNDASDDSAENVTADEMPGQESTGNNTTNNYFAPGSIQISPKIINVEYAENVF